ncbi:MAG: hypothetical protein SOZ71_02350, partial [Clostridium sp.]|nr:hypothetical protein [Clostridium sp.]
MGKNKEILEITKPVSEININIEDKIFEFIVYEELKKVCSNKIESTFDRNWIKFKYENQEGYYNNEFQIAIPIRSAYGASTGSCFGIEVIFLGLSKIKKLFDETIP